VSRAVTLPDWQGLGLLPTLVEAVSAAYKAAGKRMRVYPAHPALVAVYERRPEMWLQTKESGFKSKPGGLGFGGRPCATFEYIGPPKHGEAGLV
jgi:hypothetical protein